jgi:hypothetical protein
MTLVVRDRDTAHCLLAAHDGDEASAGISTLLHWTSMRHMYKMGAGFYNMGSAPGSLARFKQQFSPRSVTYPGAVSLVVDEKRFRLWQTVLLPLANVVRPGVRKFSGKLYQKKSNLTHPTPAFESAAARPSSSPARRTA